jgi:hypothetical protein
MRALVFLSMLCVCCGALQAKAPGPRPNLAGLFAHAFRTDATGDAREAVSGFLEVVRAAARADGDPWQVVALEASLDALSTRSMPSLGDEALDAALANRTRDAASISHGLTQAALEARGPFARGLIARALTALAERRGDAAGGESWRAAGGCARQALVIGPMTWAPVTGVDEPGPFDRADARIERSYEVGSAFHQAAHPVVVGERGCALTLSAESWRPGVREVVVDVEIPQPQTVGIAMRAHGAGRLRAGGTQILRRPFELGDGEAARFARVAVTSGTLRIAARIGTAKDDDAVEIDVWGQNGNPLTSRAPTIGSTAEARVLRVETLGAPSSESDDEILLSSAASLASGDARESERALWPFVSRSGARPELALTYGRAVETARDLSQVARAERARAAYERVLEVWPRSWEATIAHAVLAGVRRGRDEGGVEVLRDLDELRAKTKDEKAPLLDAFDALASGRERMFDRAHPALERARGALAGTAFLADVEDAVKPRLGPDLVSTSCDPTREIARDTLACFDALRASGERARAGVELGRLRAVLGAPKRFLPLELREALSSGDDAGATRAYGAMLPAERSLAALSLLDRSPDVRANLLLAATTARDAPTAIASLLSAAGDDPTREFEGVTERLIAEDRKSAIMPNAATGVLTHVERYEISDAGLVRWLLFDVRRVTGTTDVEDNAQAAAPDVWGRGAMRALRRRIFKRDGRVLEPERPPAAPQQHADLSQLEQGDTVEAIYEGWLLPSDTGDIGLDTPDLLPLRTAVRNASIELRLPHTLRHSLWSHPLLGKPTVHVEGSSEVISWHLVDHLARRLEDGVPKMEQSVGVSFSTAEWQGVARALRETIAVLDEHDPEMTSWAREAAGAEKGKPSRATVDAVVGAAGRALREADPGLLSDYAGGAAPAQSRTARTFVTSHDGSRSWLLVRSLRDVGIQSDIVVAENEPYSADNSFPPHFGRFSHPLVVASVEGKEVWIDADVQGPPLPAGRISPELRGRFALHTDGRITPLPSLAADDERDEVDVRLALDNQGNAQGTFAVVLRGRNAQELSEAFFRIVGAERQRALRDVVLAWLPWANVNDVRLASSEGSWEVGLRADVSVNGYAQLEAGRTWLLPGLDALHWSLPHAHVSSLGATFATRAGRESPLALSTALQYHVHRRVELPAGASVSHMPGPTNVRAKLVEASRSITVVPGGRSIEDDFVLGVATGTIATKDYDEFVSVAHTVDDGFLASTRVSTP